jgi:hypothetical protein
LISSTRKFGSTYPWRISYSSNVQCIVEKVHYHPERKKDSVYPRPPYHIYPTTALSPKDARLATSEYLTFCMVVDANDHSYKKKNTSRCGNTPGSSFFCRYDLGSRIARVRIYEYSRVDKCPGYRRLE